MSIDIYPLVSVILPVYNGEPYLTTALESLRDQTYPNFEVIIINDGSKDNSLDVIRSFHMPNMRVFSQNNQGLPATINRGIELSTGALIARMDQDDISEPERLGMQVRYLSLHPEIGVVGTAYKLIDTSGKVLGSRQPPCSPYQVERRLFVGNALVHGSVMFRREVVEHISKYSISEKIEDYHLWSRLVGSIQMANLSDILYCYRYKVPGGMVSQNYRQYIDETDRLRAELWQRRLPPSPWGMEMGMEKKIKYILQVRAYLHTKKKLPMDTFSRSECEYYLLTSMAIAKEAVRRKYISIAISEYTAALIINLGNFLNMAKIMRHMFASLTGKS